MKILCVIQRFYPAIGGAENVMKQYLDYLSTNHEIIVYTSDALDLSSFWSKKNSYDIDTKEQNYLVKRFKILTPTEIHHDELLFPYSISSLGPFCPEMWNSLLNLDDDFDLIVASSFPYDHMIPVFLAAKKKNIPIIIIPHIHLEFPHLHFTSSKLTILKNSDTIVVNTNNEKTHLLKYKIDEKNILVNPPGISITFDESRFSNIRKKLKIKPKSTVILFAGTKSYDKGAIFLLDSLEILWKNDLSIDLILIGPKSEEFSNHLQQKSETVRQHVHDLGIVSNDEKLSIFHSCDIFAMPSRSESFGLVYLEAWLHKKPVIGCNIEAVANLIDHSKNGLLIKFEDTKELSLAIKTLLNSTLREKLGLEGYKKLVQNYDLDKLCKIFEQICISTTEN
jgi:glycosyltransferase involved in cell wall biosynthesis